ncbi:MAG: hypothetical protein M0Q46_05780 [Endomicrobiales bacterium]|nr:hypothetical protein [Endomicrobiales bacterium]
MKMVTKAGLVLALLVSVFMVASAATPVKLSLVPELSIPSDKAVSGLDLSIASNVDTVEGLQLAWIFGGVDSKIEGVQYSFVSKANVVKGVQLGFYNGANDVTGLQWGFINVADKLKGVQIGLVNVIHKGGFLPVCVIANASF